MKELIEQLQGQVSQLQEEVAQLRHGLAYSYLCLMWLPAEMADRPETFRANLDRLDGVCRTLLQTEPEA